MPVAFSDDFGRDVPAQDATAVVITCPRSPVGKARRCIHPLGEWNGDGAAPSLARPIACPGCGWRGRLHGGALVEELEAGAADPPPA